MDTQYWQERWEQNKIEFHQDVVSPQLQRFLSELKLAPGACVFLPLCGKSKDLAWLSAQGYRALGVEVSQLAAAAFFSEQGLPTQPASKGQFESWHHGAIEILCGDYFALTDDDLFGVAAVYDRAALIALPAELRRRYAQHMQAALPPAARILLVTLEYPQAEWPGPPFSVARAEVEALYGARYAIRELYSEDALARKASFREKGLTQLIERVSLLVPRAADV
jgi:thiopurine S-methyltransferase